MSEKSIHLHNWSVVTALLAAGADPHCRDGKGWSALLWGSAMGRDANLRQFLRHPLLAGSSKALALRRRALRKVVLGAQPIAYATWLGAGNSLATFEALLECDGTDAMCVTDVGLTLLHEAALNPDATDALIGRLLSVVPAGKDGDESTDADTTLEAKKKRAKAKQQRSALSKHVRRRIAPRTATWRIVYNASRLFVKMGSKSSMLWEFYSWFHGTALHLAACEGNMVVVKALIAAGANPNAKDSRGLTPAQAARIVYGGAVPPVLQKALLQKQG